MIRKMVVFILALASFAGVAHAQFKSPAPVIPLFPSASSGKGAGSLELSISSRRTLGSVQLMSLGMNERPSLSDRINPGVLGHDMHLSTNACTRDFSTCRIAGAFHIPAQSLIRGDPAEVVFTAGWHGRVGLHYVITLR